MAHPPCLLPRHQPPKVVFYPKRRLYLPPHPVNAAEKLNEAACTANAASSTFPSLRRTPKMTQRRRVGYTPPPAPSPIPRRTPKATRRRHITPHCLYPENDTEVAYTPHAAPTLSLLRTRPESNEEVAYTPHAAA